MTEQYIAKTMVLQNQNTDQQKIEIKKYFNLTFDLYEHLFDVIADEKAFFLRAEPLRHPLIFYFGHTACFFVNKFLTAKIIDQRINSYFESIFAIGVDEMSWDDLDDTKYDWPDVASVKAYRNQVRAMVNQEIDRMNVPSTIDPTHPLWIVLMGIEHERIHLETSSVIIRQLPIEWVKPIGIWGKIDRCYDSLVPKNSLLDVQGQNIRLGKNDPTYGWDNEYGQVTAEVQSFKASEYLVSNKEFLEFILDEGYQNSSFWCEEGKRWLKSVKPEVPKFWLVEHKTYRLRLMAEIVPMPWSWPIECNYYEAKAFCNWKSQKTKRDLRLPTENEWYVMRQQVEGDLIDWQTAPGNINLEHFMSPTSVSKFRQGNFCDIVGNVWQWTETPIYPLTGFAVHPVYDDFSVPTFDGKHHLIKGGSWISTGNEAIISSRYAFRKHFYQHAGFRYIEGEPLKELIPIDGNSYESQELVNQYLEFHYGESHFGVENFPKQCIAEIKKYLATNKQQKALDIGCAVGRSTFELARYFKHVIGIDFTARFIEKAGLMLQKREIDFFVKTEGELYHEKKVTLKQLGLDLFDGIEFWQGDACNLKSHFTGFDLVFAGNLIDRLYDPKKFLFDIYTRINAGGLLVLTSPYTWLEEYTKKENWLGGYRSFEQEITTRDNLVAILEGKFKLLEYKDVPFVIRETKRKFQHTVAEMTVWKKI